MNLHGELHAIVAAVLALVLFGGGAMSQAATGSVLPSLGGCAADFHVRPIRIGPACGDGNFFITNLKWSRWNGMTASAVGIAHQNTCKPFCAGAPFRAYRVVVSLSRPETCKGGRREFTRLSWRFVSKKPPNVGAWHNTISAPFFQGSGCP
jgi:hypothetical protein